MCSARSLQPCPELPYDGPQMAVESEAVRKKHGGGLLKRRLRTKAGPGGTWNVKQLTVTSGEL